MFSSYFFLGLYFYLFIAFPIISPPPPPLAPRLLPNRRAPQTLFGTAFVLSAAAHMAENKSHPVALRTLKENAPFYQKHMRTPSDHFCIPLFATAQFFWSFNVPYKSHGFRARRTFHTYVRRGTCTLNSKIHYFLPIRLTRFLPGASKKELMCDLGLRTQIDTYISCFY